MCDHAVKCSMNNRRSVLAFVDLPSKISSPWVVRYFLPNMHSIVNSKSLFGYNLNQMIFEWGTFLGDIGLKYLFELWTPYIENISYSVKINYINITAYCLLLLSAIHKICINCRWIFSYFFLKHTWVWVFRKSRKIL